MRSLSNKINNTFKILISCLFLHSFSYKDQLEHFEIALKFGSIEAVDRMTHMMPLFHFLSLKDVCYVVAL